jgi:hypothetical protein
LFKGLDKELIRQVRGYQYKALNANQDALPEESGVYIWRYWPSLSDVSYDGIISAIQEYQRGFPVSLEKISGKWSRVDLRRNYYKPNIEEDFLGIPAKSKKYDKLMEALSASPESRMALLHAVEIIFMSAPPLYVGKAENIRKRLKEHFERRTGFSKRLDDAGINLKYIYVSYFLDEVSCEGREFSSSLEEILQRVSHPPLVKRFG